MIKRAITFPILGTLLVIAFALPLVSALTSDVNRSFLEYYWKGLARYTLPFLIAAIFITVMFFLIFNKTITENCNMKTSLLALAFSAFGSISAFCLYFAFNDDAAIFYPHQIPLYIGIGVICLLACFFVAFLYIREYVKDKKYKRLLFDLGIVILYTPAFSVTAALAYYMMTMTF